MALPFRADSGMGIWPLDLAGLLVPFGLQPYFLNTEAVAKSMATASVFLGV